MTMEDQVKDGEGDKLVLLAEDDPTISEPLARALRREGYVVTVAPDGRVALREGLSDSPYDLLVLDLGLPIMDGVEVCRKLREAGSTMPVLMLTARTEEIDTVVGLDAGADDYVTKPFRLGELLARVRALLRRGPGAPLVRTGAALRMDVDARRVFLHDREVRLTTKEFDLLRVLMREEGRVVSREVLMREVWDTWFGSTKTLAKLGNKRAKSTVEGVEEVSNAAQLADFAVEDVWGVGRKWATRLGAEGILTAGDLARADPDREQRRRHQEDALAELRAAAGGLGGPGGAGGRDRHCPGLRAGDDAPDLDPAERDRLCHRDRHDAAHGADRCGGRPAGRAAAHPRAAGHLACHRDGLRRQQCRSRRSCWGTPGVVV